MCVCVCVCVCVCRCGANRADKAPIMHPSSAPQSYQSVTFLVDTIHNVVKVHANVSTRNEHSVLVHLATSCGINNQYISESTRQFCWHSFVQQTGCMFQHRRHSQNNVPLQYDAVAMHNVNLNLVKYIDKQEQNTEKLQWDIVVV